MQEYQIKYRGFELKVTTKPRVLKESYDLDKEQIPESSTLYSGVCSEIDFKKVYQYRLETLTRKFKEAVDNHLESIPPENIGEVLRGIDFHVKTIEQANLAYRNYLISHGYEFVTEGSYEDTRYFAVHKSFVSKFHKEGRYDLPDWAIVGISEEV